MRQRSHDYIKSENSVLRVVPVSSSFHGNVSRKSGNVVDTLSLEVVQDAALRLGFHGSEAEEANPGPSKDQKKV